MATRTIQTPSRKHLAADKRSNRTHLREGEHMRLVDLAQKHAARKGTALTGCSSRHGARPVASKSSFGARRHNTEQGGCAVHAWQAGKDVAARMSECVRRARVCAALVPVRHVQTPRAALHGSCAWVHVARPDGCTLRECIHVDDGAAAGAVAQAIAACPERIFIPWCPLRGSGWRRWERAPAR